MLRIETNHSLFLQLERNQVAVPVIQEGHVLVCALPTIVALGNRNAATIDAAVHACDQLDLVRAFTIIFLKIVYKLNNVDIYSVRHGNVCCKKREERKDKGRNDHFYVVHHDLGHIKQNDLCLKL